MDDMINRNAPIAEENIDPNGRPAIDKFEEWSEEVSERTDTGYKYMFLIKKGKRYTLLAYFS